MITFNEFPLLIRRHCMKNAVRILIGVSLLVASQGAMAVTAVLSDGAIVDWSAPGSRVWLLSDDGGRSPLWNGVHSLRDGGQLSIRNDVLVTGPWSGQGALPQHGPCQQLLERVCGNDGRCSDTTACELARQMETMQRQSATDANPPGVPSQCEMALRDPAFFKLCQ